MSALPRQSKALSSGGVASALVLPNQFDDDKEEDGHKCVADQENDAKIHGVFSFPGVIRRAAFRDCPVLPQFCKRRTRDARSGAVIRHEDKRFSSKGVSRL
jgi:hypothetical protein